MVSLSFAPCATLITLVSVHFAVFIDPTAFRACLHIFCHFGRNGSTGNVIIRLDHLRTNYILALKTVFTDLPRVLSVEK
jgi:hypothetical protein